MIQINYDDWTRFSVRRNSTSYISRDQKWILKTPPKGKDFDLDELEFEKGTTAAAFSHGIPTPEIRDIALLPDGRYGLIFARVREKISYTRFISEYPERLDEMMKQYAEHAKEMHGAQISEGELPLFEARLADSLAGSPLFTEREQAQIVENAIRLPRGTSFLQGDFQPSNILLSGEGSLFIDLGLVSAGNHLFDVGFLWYFCTFSSDTVYRNIFHADRETAIACWRTFAKYYFDTDDIETVEHDVRPYGLCSVCILLKAVPTVAAIADRKELILAGK